MPTQEPPTAPYRNDLLLSVVRLKCQLEVDIFKLVNEFQSNPICEGIKVDAIKVDQESSWLLGSQRASTTLTRVAVKLVIL